jgi:ABC-type nickel/cobalt efflux system permease component RcnA
VTLTVRVAALFALVSLLLLPAVALAHPLGNFTVNRYSRLEISPQKITVHYALDLAEIPTFQAMSFLDPNGTGEVSSDAKVTYATQRLVQILPNLRLTIGGIDVPLTVKSSGVQLLPGQGNLPTLRLRAMLDAATPPSLARAGSAGLPLTYRDDNEPDRLGWREIVVSGVDGVSVGHSTVSSKDASNELRSYPTDMLAKPLDEREASALLIVSSAADGAGSAAGTATPLSSDTDRRRQIGKVAQDTLSRLTTLLGISGAASTAPAMASDTAPGPIGVALGQATSLSKIVAAGQLGPVAVAGAFLLAALWGAAHAFTPGHGKTIVAAYLVGSRGTARHALYLGLTVTATHTMGIYALGVITLLAARFILPEVLYPWLALLSGLAVVAVGLITMVSRARAVAHGTTEHAHYTHDHHEHGHVHAHDNGHDDHAPLHRPQRTHVMLATDGAAIPVLSAVPEVGHTHEQLPDLHYDHDHGDGHTHDHSHLPPGADGSPVTLRSLLALGVAGGILPCPSALVLLLGATALGQSAFGLALVAAFSIGLAGVLVGIGFAFVYARQSLSARGFPVHPRMRRLLRLAPTGSSFLIALVGLGMTAEALGQLGLFGRL